MHQARQGRVRRIANGIGKFVRKMNDFGRVGDELTADRVVRVLDQRLDRRGDGRGVARADTFQTGEGTAG